MKVLYIHQHFSTPKGAVGNRSYQMALALLERGHEVTMLCGRYAGGDTGISEEFKNGRRVGVVDGIQVIECDLPYSNAHSFLRRTSTFLLFVARTLHVVLTKDYDVLFATSTPLTVAMPGIAARWLRRKTFVFEVRDLWPELPRAMGAIRNPVVLAALSMLEWAGYRSAHRLIGLSPGIVDGIIRRGIHKDNVTMIPNGCDLDVFDRDCAPASGIGEAMVAIYAGTHGRANALANVLAAAMLVQARGRNDIIVMLVGNGSEKPLLLKEAQGLRNVQFIDAMPKNQLADLFARADIGLQSLANVPAFYYGTSPNKFFDYLSAGLPVLCNYPGWVAELITEYDCGFVVPPDCPKAFADALEAAADDRTRLKEMGRRARNMGRDQFARRDLANAWCSWVIDGHVSKRSSPGG